MTLDSLSPSKWHPLGLSCIALLLYILYQYYLHPLHRYPGPLLAKFTDYWRFQDVRSRKSHLSRVALHKKLGPVVRVGPNTLSIADPAYIPKIYGAGQGFVKSPFYHPFQGWVGDKIGYNLFTTRDAAYHSALKKPVAAAYSLKAALEFEPIVDECIEAIVRHLDEYVIKGDKKNKKAWDMAAWMQYYSFDVMALMTWGKAFGFLERGQDVNGMIKRLDARLDVISPQTQMPWLDYLLVKNPIVNLFGFRDRTNAFATFAAKLIQERQQELPTSITASTADSKLARRLFIDHFLAAQHSHPATVDARTVVIYTTTNIMAGSDTVAIALRTVFYMLMRHSAVYARLQAEIDAAFVAFTKPSSGTTEPSVSNKHHTEHTPFTFPLAATADLPYLTATINEALRIHPPVGLPLERVVPGAGLRMHNDSHILPPGTQVSCHAWPMHHLSSTWGADPHLFRPERWLRNETGNETTDAYKARLRSMHDSLLSFGAGSRVCMGRHLSMLQITKLVPSLLLRYRFALVDPEKEWDVVCGWFVRQAGMDVFVERRGEVLAR
ncbi:cytochrome P450 [Coniella lustricola]|uniref:Cytochrome P450 n=1 Tax=Coniella lustricola TaxID=2025994 RepID=A0A2T2ZZ03_9PEZI|nr:cytochrome P450 [Coniella lustricola]